MSRHPANRPLVQVAACGLMLFVVAFWALVFTGLITFIIWALHHS